ncbi:unnamed protein product [Acanthoscelides obtectus]|uniref:Uncharacterized protein n=1 Tax=Acanthoscelides obtectus TaxID=200917 RepID=A0A9P0KXI1_ACAOB|nr:unnamed protein product [Acanthoscelides obtectus]CAK1643165.1 hypothetical protein AOBTE_LOCUS13429 [Acanthoscelides obtectus]
MYKLYQEFCIDKQELPVKESYCRHIFNTEFNLRFHKPYSDTCSHCDNLQNLIKYSTNEEDQSCTKEKPRKQQMPKKLILLKIKMILKIRL